MRYLPILLFSALTLGSPINGLASTPDVPSAIENFVSKLYPQDSHYFWVINNATTESPQELIVDVLTTLRGPSDDSAKESRFLLLIIKGKILAAQKIPLNAEVNCGKDEEV